MSIPDFDSENVLVDLSTKTQRPSSIKVPDTTHLIGKTFGTLFTRDVLTAETIQNLSTSSQVSNEYHKGYVDKLKQAQIFKETRVQEYAYIETHILESKARSIAFEEKESENRRKLSKNPDELGIPPTKSFFNACVDNYYIKKSGLLAPIDYNKKNESNLFLPIDETLLRNKQQVAMSTLSNILESQYTKLPPINEASIDSNEIQHEKRNVLWKSNLDHTERTELRILLKNYEKKTRFLLNPRRKKNFKQSIQPIPQLIEFNKHIIGKVYEKTLELWNINDQSQQLRVFPPKTQYFSLSLGQYPKSESVIAPGMSAFFNLKFAPDSLCTFEDKIHIECSDGNSFDVSIVAKRKPPLLSIGPIFDCGEALVGQMKVCRFVVENRGGDGRFIILPKSSWPTTNFKTNVSSANLNMNIFEIQPSIFEIQEGDTFVLEILFKPTDVEQYEQDIVIACDNCTTKEFKIKGEGQLALIEVIDSEANLVIEETDPAFMEELKDYWSNYVMKFGDLNPNMFSKKKIAVVNKSSSPIDFTWVLYKPIIEDNLFKEKNKPIYKYILDNQTSFVIEPNHGILDRSSSKTFEITFAPVKVDSYDNVMHLVLHGIPEINKQMLNDKLNQLHKTTLTREETLTTDHIALQIELKGKCEPYQYTLDPPAIFFPSSFYVHSTFRKGFRLINMSLCPIHFQWEQITEGHVIMVEPSYGEIAAKSYALMEVLVTGTKPGKLHEQIACFIDFVGNPIYLTIDADIKGPECRIHEPSIDFGLVRLNRISKAQFTLENISNLPVKWFLTCFENKVIVLPKKRAEA